MKKGKEKKRKNPESFLKVGRIIKFRMLRSEYPERFLKINAGVKIGGRKINLEEPREISQGFEEFTKFRMKIWNVPRGFSR